MQIENGNTMRKKKLRVKPNIVEVTETKNTKMGEIPKNIQAPIWKLLQQKMLNP